MTNQMNADTDKTPPVDESVLVPTFVGRQPMFDANLETRAYELLYRNSSENWADYLDSDLATGQTFWNTFIELGQEQVADGQRAYVNVTPTFLRSNCIEIFPKDKLALEVQSGDLMDKNVQEIIRELKSEGFRFVLDADGPQSIQDVMFDLIDELKIDVSTGAPADCATVVTAAKDAGKLTIAKRIETFDCFEECRRAGFQIFQGHFLAKPQIVMGGRLPADGISRMKILSAVNNLDSGIEKLQEAISQDVGLSYKLLHYVNSAMFAFRSEIESIQQAVMMLGLRWIRTWANLVILSGIPDKPTAIFNMAVVRAKMCELLSQEVRAEHPEMFFTTGLLSTLECLLDRPMKEILAELPVSNELAAALLNREGDLGEALDCTLHYERSAWDHVSFKDLDPSTIRDSYLTALQWAADLRGNLKK